MDEITGTWFSPQGTKVQVTAIEEGWLVGIYLFKRSKTPMGSKVHTDPERVRQMIRELEASGHTKQLT